MRVFFATTFLMSSPLHQGLTTPRGFRAAGGVCGIKASGKPDLTLIVADQPCAAAAVFTQSRLPGAPVIVGKRQLKKPVAQAILVNSGIANDATGQQGIDNALACTHHVADQLGLDPGHVIPSSTGVIGPQIPVDKITRGIDALIPQLASGPQADTAAATGIMTTDLVPKSAYTTLKIHGQTVHLAGIAKGSGMIAPNMATMLVFLTTDAVIQADLLKQALTEAVNVSFNRMSVDQHTSPSDTALILASGLAKHPALTPSTAEYEQFAQALAQLCQDLAYQIVKDGEGAQRVFRVRVLEAKNTREADRVARPVINSPLVKTAVHGSDPNWGRIVTAAANSGVALVPDKLSLDISDLRGRLVRVFNLGTPIEHQGQTLKKLQSIMKQPEITFTLYLGRGDAQVEWLGCDLSRQYIAINADYTT